jgi:hypothetical protein
MKGLVALALCAVMVHGQSSSTPIQSSSTVNATIQESTPNATTTAAVTVTTTTEECPLSLCANATTVCNYQSNEDVACLTLALCLGGFEPDYTPGSCAGTAREACCARVDMI